MKAYEQLDAFRVCHELTMTAHRVLKTFEERDPELAAQLWCAVMVASSRIVRGTAMSNRRLYVASVDRTLGALSEVGYFLQLAKTLDLLSEQDDKVLEGLRGRAVFYSSKLLLSLIDGTEGAG